MKTKSTLTLFLLLISFVNNGFTQSTKTAPSLNVAGELIIPTGNSSTTHKVGEGGNLKAIFPLFKRADVTFSFGYYFLAGEKYQSGGTLNINAIPVKAGIRYYSLSKSFYLEPQAGYTQFYYEKLGQLPREYFGAFTYAGNIGYIISKHFDFSARYEEALFKGPDFAHFAFRLGYAFLK